MHEQKYSLSMSQQVLSQSSLPYTIVIQNDNLNSSSQNYQFSAQQYISQQSNNINNNQIQSNQSSSFKSQSQSRDPYYQQFLNNRLKYDVRNSYLSKLMNQGYIPQQPRKKYRHLFVFDWDDTFLCTTYLNHFNSTQLKEKDQKLLEKMDLYVTQILDASIKLGDVSIITNAAKGWVEYSSKKYLPKTNQFIKINKIVIISARQKYADQFPNQIKKWKVSAFQKLNSQQNKHLITNIICVGDSTIQMQAGQILASSFEKSLLKTVKFRQNPKIQQLVKQQQLLVKKLDEIVNTAKNLTIRLERKTVAK